MKTKKVNRYYCDFCKKAGGSAGHMRRHEKHCTLNPRRTCGVCKLIEADPPPLSDLVAVLPDVEKYTIGISPEHTFHSGLTGDANFALKKLREAAENCPACILAAIRQAGIPVPLVTDFDFTTEMEAVWAKVNAENAREAQYG